MRLAINLKKLEMVKEAGDGKSIARCPACARNGGDSKGIHLVVYPDGRFGCAAHPGDGEHRKEIFRLVGTRTRSEGSKPKPFSINYEGW